MIKVNLIELTIQIFVTVVDLLRRFLEAQETNINCLHILHEKAVHETAAQETLQRCITQFQSKGIRSQFVRRAYHLIYNADKEFNVRRCKKQVNYITEWKTKTLDLPFLCASADRDCLS
jgi:hypothetical protein